MQDSGDRAFRAESLYGMGSENTFSGALSFLRRKYSRDLTGADVVVSGLPFDLAVSNRPGARFGPRAIRAASTNLAWPSSYWPWTVSPFKKLAVVDYGDCDYDFGHQDQFVETVEAFADEILASGASMLTFGGDHFVSYPLLKAHYKIHGPVSLVHFDAHSDTWRDEPGHVYHGSMFFFAAEEGLVAPEKSVHIGLRTLNKETHGFNILDADFVHRNGPDAVIEAVKEIVGDNKAYLTFDIDCLDPAFAPGTGTPVTGGLSAWQAQTIIRGLGGINFIGMDMVEVAPAYDVSEITALAAAHLCLDYLCLLASQKA